MTKEQITHILGSYELNANQWLAIEDYFPLIYLAQDANVYPLDSIERYRFNNNTELLEIVHGSIKNDAFVSSTGETSNFTADSFISYDLISGFCRTVRRGPMGSYLSTN